MAQDRARAVARLAAENIKHRVVSRIKSPYSIYTKMRGEHKTFAQVMDVYGFRVVVDATMECYHALGAIHALYKPLEARFRDFIAIPKANGYQSLHTVLFGPFGAPIEIQIRTEEMDPIAERGVAAHWVYKTAEPGHRAQTRAREWVEGLVEAQTREASSLGVPRERQGRSVPGRGVPVHAEGRDLRCRATRPRSTSPTPCTPMSAITRSPRASTRNSCRCASA